MEKEYIRDFYGKIIGSVETDNKGNQTLRNFHGRILGYYDKQNNVTRDFYKKIVGRGNILTSLLYKGK